MRINLFVVNWTRRSKRSRAASSSPRWVNQAKVIVGEASAGLSVPLQGLPERFARPLC